MKQDNGNGEKKPKDEEVSETKKDDGGTDGTKPVNPSNEGGDIKLTKPPSDEREEIGEGGEITGDTGAPVVEKVQNELGYIKKSIKI